MLVSGEGNYTMSTPGYEVTSKSLKNWKIQNQSRFLLGPLWEEKPVRGSFLFTNQHVQPVISVLVAPLQNQLSFQQKIHPFSDKIAGYPCILWS